MLLVGSACRTGQPLSRVRIGGNLIAHANHIRLICDNLVKVSKAVKHFIVTITELHLKMSISLFFSLSLWCGRPLMKTKYWRWNLSAHTPVHTGIAHKYHVNFNSGAFSSIFRHLCDARTSEACPTHYSKYIWHQNAMGFRFDVLAFPSSTNIFRTTSCAVFANIVPFSWYAQSERNEGGGSERCERTANTMKMQNAYMRATSVQTYMRYTLNGNIHSKIQLRIGETVFAFAFVQHALQRHTHTYTCFWMRTYASQIRLSPCVCVCVCFCHAQDLCIAEY